MGPGKLYEQAIPASVRTAMAEAMEASGRPNPWAPPEDATPEQLAEMQERWAKMMVPDEAITTWVDVSGAPLEAKWRAMKRHVTQISDENWFMSMGIDAWRQWWDKEAFILRASRVETALPESDLFAGLA